MTETWSNDQESNYHGGEWDTTEDPSSGPAPRVPPSYCSRHVEPHMHVNQNDETQNILETELVFAQLELSRIPCKKCNC